MELNIYFKNVGQGDTLILEWSATGTNDWKFALIDCHLINGEIAAVTKHIESRKITEFEFVLMSHPHSDHFSGFPKFMNYCEAREITIKRFLHTSAFNAIFLSGLLGKNRTPHQRVATSSVNRKKHKKKLWKIFEILHKENAKNGSGFIKEVHALNNDYSIDLTEDIQINFLSPFISEIRSYIKAVYHINDKERLELTQKTENNPKANLLSTVVQIVCKKKDWQIILCSDATIESLSRIMNNNDRFELIRGKKLLAAQIPHHGSKANHLEAFWEKIKTINKSSIIISVGEGYGHPSPNVIEYFDDIAKDIHATNLVGGYYEFFRKKDKKTEKKIMPSILGFPGLNFSHVQHFEQEDLSCPTCCEKQLKITAVDDVPRCEVLDIPYD